MLKTGEMLNIVAQQQKGGVGGGKGGALTDVFTCWLTNFSQEL